MWSNFFCYIKSLCLSIQRHPSSTWVASIQPLPHSDAGLDGVMIFIVVATVVEAAVIVVVVSPCPSLLVLFPLKDVTFFLKGGSRGVPSDPGSKDFVSVPFLWEVKSSTMTSMTTRATTIPTSTTSRQTLERRPYWYTLLRSRHTMFRGERVDNKVSQSCCK